MPQARDSHIPPSGPASRLGVETQAERTTPEPRPPAKPGRHNGRRHRRIALIVGIAAILFAVLLIWMGVSSVNADPVAIASFGVIPRNQDLKVTFQLANHKDEPVSAAGSATIKFYDGIGNLVFLQRVSFAKGDFDRASTAYSMTIPKTRLDLSDSVDRSDVFAAAVLGASTSLGNGHAVLTVILNNGENTFTAVLGDIQFYSADEAELIARRIYFGDEVQVLEAEINRQWSFAVRISDYAMIGDRGWAVVGRSGSEIIFYPYATIYNYYLLETEDGGRSWGIAWKGNTEPVFKVELLDGSKVKITTASVVFELNSKGEQAVDFVDANLEAAIREAMDITEEQIYPSELQGLTSLYAVNRNITDLTGLEHCGNLEVLYLQENQIRSISALAGLTNLTVLILHDNRIDDISPLAGLTRLTTLQVSNNEISDIASLADLRGLEYLYLSVNDISDVSALAGLSNLAIVMLLQNRISDISPLVENQGIGDGDSLGLTGNPLSEMSLITYLPELRGRGVNVIWPVTAPSVVTGSGEDSGTSGGPGPEPAPRLSPGPAPRPDSGPGPDPP